MLYDLNKRRASDVEMPLITAAGWVSNYSTSLSKYMCTFITLAFDLQTSLLHKQTPCLVNVHKQRLKANFRAQINVNICNLTISFFRGMGGSLGTLRGRNLTRSLNSFPAALEMLCLLGRPLNRRQKPLNLATE